jgi:uncharacterized membrane protein YraQ (UPF0718 family)
MSVDDRSVGDELSDERLLTVCSLCWLPTLVGAVVWRAPALGLIAGLLTVVVIGAALSIRRDQSSSAAETVVMLRPRESPVEQPETHATPRRAEPLPGEVLSPPAAG